MNDKLSFILIKKFENDLSSLKEKYHYLDKEIEKINLKIKQDKEELKKIESKTISSYISNHWTKLPQAAIIVGGFIWFANWLYDLPSAEQQKRIKQLEEHLVHHK